MIDFVSCEKSTGGYKSDLNRRGVPPTSMASFPPKRMRMDHISDIWVIDWWSGQKEADVWIDSQLDLMKAHQPFCWFGESGVIKRAISPFLGRRMQEREVYGRVEWITSIADKVTKARGFQGRAAAGKVHLPEGRVGDEILDQLLRFPTGKHDDKVDVFSIFCLALDQAHPAIFHKEKKIRSLADIRIDYLEKKRPISQYEDYVLRDHAVDQRFWRHVQGGPRGEPVKEARKGRCYSDIDGR
jgi:hypothetical protein